jgi:hypothetical protein
MMARIHLIVGERERDAFRAGASAAGVTLSEWLREAARAQLTKDRPERIASVEDLDRFFRACAEVEDGTEPEWGEHLAVMERSRRGTLERT